MSSVPMMSKKKGFDCSRLCRTGVGHAQGSWSIGNALMFLSNLIGDAAFGVALVGLPIAALEGGAGSWTSSTRAVAVGILGMWTSKLIHEVGDLKYDMVWIDNEIRQTDESVHLYANR